MFVIAVSYASPSRPSLSYSTTNIQDRGAAQEVVAMDSANIGSRFRARLQMPPQKDMLLFDQRCITGYVLGAGAGYMCVAYSCLVTTAVRVSLACIRRYGLVTNQRIV